MMKSILWRVCLGVALLAPPALTNAQRITTTWLDETKPAAWNTPGAAIPSAPNPLGTVDPRCRAQARPPQLAEDKQVRDRGWDLVGGYHGGWQMVVIRGAASYDGMCRPRQYQEFVFVKGTFAGALSPRPMDSRTDGSLTRVVLQGPARLAAEYARYAEQDPLCCPSGTTSVRYEMASASPTIVPVSAITTRVESGQSRGAGPPTSLKGTLGGTAWQLVGFQGGDGTTLRPDDRTNYTIEFRDDGSLSARIDCNRGRGTWSSSGASQIVFGPLALTRAACPPGSLHDQLVRQWGSVRSYVMKDGHLFLSLMADGGIFEFEPVSPNAR